MSPKSKIDIGAEGERDLVPFIRKAKGKRGGTNLRRFIGELREHSGGFGITKRKGQGGGSRMFGGKIGSKSPSYYQRVSVKARFVKNEFGVGSKGITRHIKYLQREGVSQTGAGGEIFSNAGKLDAEELKNIASEWGNDRHYWRIIISPEVGSDLDLESFAKDVIHGLERDLDTKLTWIAAAHYNTDKSHIHLTIRGKRDNGQDLVIPKDYIAYGMRHLAERIATDKLGVRTELQVERQLDKEVSKDHIVTIDRVLFRQAKRGDGTINLTDKLSFETAKTKNQRLLKTKRLKHLRALGLATEIRAGVWTLAKGAEGILREMGIKGDIIKTMSRYGKTEDPSRYVIYRGSNQTDITITGRVAHRGLSDELNERKFIIVEAVDGNSYYVNLGRFSERPGYEAWTGHIVEISPYKSKVTLTKADKNIFELSQINNGAYSEAFHRRYVASNVKLPPDVSIDEYILPHKRRLEALEKKRIVTPIGAGEWRIPRDYLELIQKQQDLSARSKDLSVTTQSKQPLMSQVDTRGVTWLDKALIKESLSLNSSVPSTFQIELKQFLTGRLNFLSTLGETLQLNGNLIPKEGFIDRLYDLELLAAEKKLAQDFCYAARISTLKSFTGSVKSIQDLPSGPHLLVVGEGKFTLIPERPGMQSLKPGDKARFDVLGQPLTFEQGVPALKQVRVNFEPLGQKKRRGYRY